MVMEKSWNMEHWPKIMGFCEQSYNVTNLAPNCAKFVFFWVTSKSLSSDLESPEFPRFSAKRRKCKIEKKDGNPVLDGSVTLCGKLATTQREF